MNMYALYCTKNVLQKSTKNWIQYLLDAILVRDSVSYEFLSTAHKYGSRLGPWNEQ